MRTPVVRAWASRETAAVLERELGLLARYRVDVQAWPLSIALSDVVIEGSDGLGTALEAVRIAVRPRLFALMGGRLDAGHIEIDGPRVRAVVRDGELENVKYRLPPTKDRGPVRHAPFLSIAITDAAMDLDIEGLRLRGHDIDIDVSADEGPVFDFVVRAGEQSLVRERPILSIDPDVAPGTATDEDALCRLDARVRFARGSLLVRRLALSGMVDADEQPGTLPSCGAGSEDPRRLELELGHVLVTLPQSGRPDVEGSVHARAPLGVINRFIPFPPLHGYVTADLEGHFASTSALPVVRGKVGAVGVELERYHLMQQFSADVSLEGEQIRSEQVSIAFGDGTLVAKNVAVEPFKKGAPVRIGSIDGANVSFAAMMRDLGVTPHAHVNWLYKATHVGNLEGTLAPLKLDADFTGTTTDFEVFDRAVDDPARHHMIGVKEARVGGHASIRPDAVIFRNSRVDFGDSHIEASVSLGFHSDLQLTVSPGAKVDLSNISPLANLKLAGKATVGAEMKGTFSDPVLTGDLAITNFALADFPLGDISSSKVRFHPLTVDFWELHATKGKSAFDVPTGRLDFNGPATLVADATVDAADLYVRDFLHMWHFDTDPRFEQVDGHGRTKASVHYELGGPSDICGGGILGVRGTLHMSAMDLFEEHYDTLDSEFTYNWLDRDAADLGLDIDIRSLTLKKGRGSIFGSGTIRRGGNVRMQIVADDVPLSRMQAMGPSAKLLDGFASAVGTVSGTLEELEADVDVKLSPLRMGGSVLPASKFHLELIPVKKDARVPASAKRRRPASSR